MNLGVDVTWEGTPFTKAKQRCTPLNGSPSDGVTYDVSC